MTSGIRCKLIIPRDRFSEELKKQIAQGKLLLDVNIAPIPGELQGWENILGNPNKQKFERLQSQYIQWHSRNKELLKQSFSESENEYLEVFNNVGFLRLLEKNDTGTLFVKVIRDEISELESLLARVDLIPCKLDTTSNSEIGADKEMEADKVFIVYGHDRVMKLEVENFLRSRLKLEVVALDEEPNGGRTIIEKFEHYSKDCVFAVVLMSPDDDVEVDGQVFKRARQNVVLELGYFMAKLGREKVCVLVRGNIEKPSDISGILHLSYDGEWKFDLLSELKHAGLEM